MNRRTRSEHRSSRVAGRHRELPFPPSDDPVARDRDGPIGRLQEWNVHRYDPGYYLGGRIPPLIRALQGGGPGGRMYGSLLIAFSAIALLWAAGTARRSGLHGVDVLASFGYQLAIGVILLAAGVVALDRARRRGKKRE